MAAANWIGCTAGTLADAFACTAAIGKNGCGFESHLESMRAALDDNPANAGFLRDEAYLGVLIVADEDDCSAADGAFFDAESDMLGPIDSFRCFEKAIACDQGRDIELREVGMKTGCHPDDTQTYLHHVDEYVTFLLGLKRDPADVVVGGIFGDPEPVVVTTRTPTGTEMPRWDLEPSCTFGAVPSTNTADPAIRLDAFLAAFPRHTEATICAGDYAPALAEFGTALARLNDPCITAAIALPPDCTFSLVTPAGDQTIVAECDTGGDPCWRLAPDDRCADTPTGLGLAIERTVEPPPGTRVVGTCRVD